jgi:hypothetical protein
MFKGISRSLPPFAMLILIASFLFAGHTFGYALIDLDPGSPERAMAASSTEMEAKSTKAVEASFKQRGHLLALVPVNLSVKVKAFANGDLELDYPWYTFMTISHREEIETKLKIAINNVRNRSALGTVRAEGETVNPQFTEKEAAEIRKILIEELGSEK